MKDVVIVDTGVANAASILGAFSQLGASATLVTDQAEIAEASYIVLPGVGAFEAGMGRIRDLGLESALRDAFDRDVPILAICLGMQLLCLGSEEAPGVRGLGIISGQCRRLPENVRVPHLGWNLVEPAELTGSTSSGLISSGYAAFANSYVLTAVPDGWRPSYTRYGLRFVSAIERGRLLACQFHPELSGSYGIDLISRWLNGTPARSTHSIRDGEQAGQPTPSSSEGIHRIIACLDVRDGRVVKGVRFQNIRDAGDPAELAAEYEHQGADEIVVLDIAAAPAGLETRLDTVRRVRAGITIPLTVGGGVRTVEDARRLLEAGADRISVNTAAVRDPLLLTRLADAFGRQCVTLAIDARRKERSWEVLAVGGRESTGLDAVRWAEEGETRGAGEILLTSWDRDGTRSGSDTELLAAVSRVVTIPVIASGGIGKEEDVADAIEAGASAVLAASIFHDGDHRVGDIKDYLKKRGIAVRT